MTSHKLLNDFVFVLHLLFICLFVSSSSVQASFVLGELGDWGSCIFFTHTPRSPMMPCITPLQLAGPPTPPPQPPPVHVCLLFATTRLGRKPGWTANCLLSSLSRRVWTAQCLSLRLSPFSACVTAMDDGSVSSSSTTQNFQVGSRWWCLSWSPVCWLSLLPNLKCVLTGWQCVVILMWLSAVDWVLKPTDKLTNRVNKHVLETQLMEVLLQKVWHRVTPC